MSEPLIVVPIDGSEVSERAVPYASAIAGATSARLLILTVRHGRMLLDPAELE